ncbi:MAG: hypothetical protein ACJAUL_003432 [Paraglaciecola sp.]|jgi:hypothetical protein
METANDKITIDWVSDTDWVISGIVNGVVNGTSTALKITKLLVQLFLQPPWMPCSVLPSDKKRYVWPLSGLIMSVQLNCITTLPSTKQRINNI